MLSTRFAIACLAVIALAQYQVLVSADVCSSLNRLPGTAGQGCGACQPSFFGLPAGSLCPCEPAVMLYGLRMRALGVTRLGEPKIFLGGLPASWPTNRVDKSNLGIDFYQATNTFSFAMDAAQLVTATVNGQSLSFDASALSHPKCNPNLLNTVQLIVRTAGGADVQLSSLQLGGNASPFTNLASVQSTSTTPVVFGDIANSRLRQFSFSGSFSLVNKTACTSSEGCKVEINVGCAPVPKIETLSAARFRNFKANGGVQLVFVGTPDLGVAANRAEGGNVWANGARAVRFWRDGSVIKATNGANTVSYPLPTSATCTPDKYNFLRVVARQSSADAGAAVSVSDVKVNGANYPSTAGSVSGVTADYLNVAGLSSFDISATVNIGNRDTCSQEGCRVELQVGCHQTCAADYEDQPIEVCDCPSGKIRDGCTNVVASNPSGKCVCISGDDAPGPCGDDSLTCTL